MKYKVIFEDLGLKDYKESWDYQESLFRGIISAKLRLKSSSREVNTTPGHLLFVEHPHVYTLGKSGSENNLLLNFVQLQTKDAAFYKTNRGGDITYHGPGQVVGYPIFDLEAAGIGLKDYIFKLEEAVILTLKAYGLVGSRFSGATGVWLQAENKIPRKICAIGVRSSRYVTMHGFAFNVNTNLDYFKYINPCGYTDKAVSSLNAELGRTVDYSQSKEIMKKSLEKVFNIEWVH